MFQKVEAQLLPIFLFLQKHMISQFKIFSQEQIGNTAVIEKAPATVLDTMTLGALDAGWLLIKATAASTSLVPIIAVLNDTQVLVSKDKSAVLEMTSDAPFAKAMRNTEIDLAIDWSGNQLADVGASFTDVLKVLASNWPERVGTTKILVRINKFIEC